MTDPPIWVLVLLIATALVLNTVAWSAWTRDLLPPWWRAAVGVVTLVVLVGYSNSWGIFVGGLLVLAGLTIIGAWAWWRKRELGRHSA